MCEVFEEKRASLGEPLECEAKAGVQHGKQQGKQLVQRIVFDYVNIRRVMSYS